MSFNKIIIFGNLGRDPELRHTAQGKAVCDFSVATSERRKDQNGEVKEETTWFRVTYWERQAEVASQYLKKGSQVYIEGRLHAREWTDKEGRVHTNLEVRGSELKLIGNREEEMAAATTNVGSNSIISNGSATAVPGQANAKRSAAKPTAASIGKVEIDDSDIGF